MADMQEISPSTLNNSEIVEQMRERQTRMLEAMHDPEVISRVADLTGYPPEVISASFAAYVGLACNQIDEYAREPRNS